MAHSLFPRKEGDSVVTIIELTILYCMVNKKQLDVCYVIATKLKDLATKRMGAIKVGGLVLSIVNYLGFNVDNMPFAQLHGNTRIDLHMMEAMGMLTIGLGGVPTLLGDQVRQQAMAEEKEKEVNLQQVMDRLDNIELQVGVIDSNVDEIRHEDRIMNHNLLAFFHNHNFFPPPSQGSPQ